MLGRGADCDVVVASRGVSGHHAVLRYRHGKDMNLAGGRWLQLPAATSSPKSCNFTFQNILVFGIDQSGELDLVLFAVPFLLQFRSIDHPSRTYP